MMVVVDVVAAANSCEEARHYYSRFYSLHAAAAAVPLAKLHCTFDWLT